jgi:hypothetical protein
MLFTISDFLADLQNAWCVTASIVRLRRSIIAALYHKLLPLINTGYVAV